MVERQRQRNSEQDAVIKRVNRKLHPQGEKLVVARSDASKRELGAFYRATLEGIVTHKHVDLTQLAVELGCVKEKVLAATA